MNEDSLKNFFNSTSANLKKFSIEEVTSNSQVSETKSIYLIERSSSKYVASYYTNPEQSATKSVAKHNQNFSDWMQFLENKAKEALENKKKEKDSYYIVQQLKKEVQSKCKEKKYNYLETLLANDNFNIEVSLPSLFNSIRFTYEMSSDVIDKSVFFIDTDSQYVNMAFVNSESRLDLTFKDNGEISFRFIDCDGGRIRITGTSFFGLGGNQKETRKINKLIGLAKKDF
ncbi:hypothetical protein [Pantoea sp. EEL5]|uniref:hypothetical protein n=1 Tax=Pantoea sp. EEL5 TaxID=3416806 RepID=UPI003CE6D39E